MPKVFKDENRIRKIYKGSQKMRKAYYRDMVVYSAREDYSDTVDTKNVLHVHSVSDYTTSTVKTGCADTGYSSPTTANCAHYTGLSATAQFNVSTGYCPICGGYGAELARPKAGAGTLGSSCVGSSTIAGGYCPTDGAFGAYVSGSATHSQSVARTLYKCTRTTSTVVGTCYMTKTTTEEDTYKLKANVTSVTATAFAWSNGATTQEINVTSNGTYTCNVTIKEPTGSSQRITLTYEVTDY